MISVVVPIYNCASYLDRGIHSLINQTIFNELEIIFINDGSDDNSELILQTYIDKYSNMKLICQKNKGVSAARNRGIEEARGEYIAFFDADDIADETLYEELRNLLLNFNADLSCVNYMKIFSDGIKKVQKKEVYKIYSGDEIIKEFFLSDVLCNNTVDKLFKRSLLDDLKFPEGYAIGEDMYFVFLYLLKSDKIAVDTTKCLYQYCIRESSAMKSSFSKKYFDSVILSNKMMEIVQKNGTLYALTEANWIHEVCKTLALFYQDENSEYYEQIGEYKNIIKRYPINKAYKLLSFKHFLALLLMRYSPKLYVKTYNFLRVG